MSLPCKEFQALVIGSSAGGVYALSAVLSTLPADFSLPILIVQHMHPHSKSQLASILQKKAQLSIREAEEKERIQPGVVYLAPPNYHLLVELDRHLALSIDERVNYSRPAIDLLFESAVDAYRDKLIGLILTGANSDGAAGLRRIKQAGGYALVQDPQSAEADAMPLAACSATSVDKVLPLHEIGPHLLQLVNHYPRCLNARRSELKHSS